MGYVSARTFDELQFIMKYVMWTNVHFPKNSESKTDHELDFPPLAGYSYV